MLSVVDCLWAMLLATHASFELNDNKIQIENVRYILTTFNGDVLFELPPCGQS